MGRRWFFGLILLVMILSLLFSALLTVDEYFKSPFSLSKLSQLEAWPSQVGHRVAGLRARIPTVNRVVIVPDEATFLAAIQGWSLAGRWPILVDDPVYTPIFIERFQPAEVVRLPTVKKTLPTDDNLFSALRIAIAKAWDATDFGSLEEGWQKLGWDPPGVVMTWEKDPSWPAAVALAAYWGQPLVLLKDHFGLPNDSLNLEQWQNLTTTVEQAVEKTGYFYSSLGDTIDTVTIVGQLAAKYQNPLNHREDLAVTDGLARNENGDRWAVVGWIYGTTARAVYQAMCSIFLDVQSALLYDSYPHEGKWQNYEMTTAESLFSEQGLRVNLIQRPEAGVSNWRSLLTQKWKFDLIFVNTKGSKDYFDLGDGQAHVDDIPKLRFPAAIHFLHSFSAANPDDPNTIAGRWLENGAYLYVGSVHEPYLDAFVPPDVIAKRMDDYFPFLLAARHLESAPWKITTIGDPLMTTLAEPRGRISPSEQPLKK